MHEEQPADDSQLAKFTFPDGNVYDGAIKLVGKNNFELSVDDLPEQAWQTIDHLEAQAKKEEDKYLFIDVRYGGRSSHEGRINAGSTTYFWPSTTFRTNEPENPLSQNVTGLDVNIENLDLWFNQSLFAFHNPMKMTDTLEYSMQKDIGEYDFHGYKLRFGLAVSGMGHWRLTREVSLKQNAFVELRTADHSDVPYLDLVKALRSLERLLSLAFRSPIQTVEVSVTSNDFSLTIGGEKVPNIWPAYTITLSDARPEIPAVRLGEELGFTLDQIQDFQVILNKWVELEGQVTPVVDLLLTSVSGGSTVLENIFLNRIQGIEGFHRSFREGTISPQEEYEKEVDEIVGGFSGKRKNLLKKVLKHGNDVSLADRLRSLDSELKLKGIATIMACDMPVVANTRNYYSHYEKDITDICPEDKMIMLTHEAGQMLLALILTELGIDSAIVAKAVKRMSTL